MCAMVVGLRFQGIVLFGSCNTRSGEATGLADKLSSMNGGGEGGRVETDLWVSLCLKMRSKG